MRRLADYIATREPMDKAGAYGIQGYGAKFIPKVERLLFQRNGPAAAHIVHHAYRAGVLTPASYIPEANQ